MAKIVFGPNIVDARNAEGGIVYTRGTHGPFTRSHVTPLNPPGTHRVEIRAAYKAAYLHWQNDLTDAHRLSWDAFARLHPTRRPIGGIVPISGFQAFMKLNTRQAWEEEAWLDYAPPNQTVTELGSILALTANHTGPHLWVTLAAVPTGSEYAEVYASPLLSAGIRSCWRQVCAIDAITPADANPKDCGGNWAVRYGTMTAGKRLGVAVLNYNPTNGATTRRLVSSCLIA